jgi:hypothetical protein
MRAIATALVFLCILLNVSFTFTQPDMMVWITAYPDPATIEDGSCFTGRNANEYVALQFLVAPRRFYFGARETCTGHFP